MIEQEARIAVLPAALADQIAAGEVVERPGSIVKELVENSIDAGATRVEVELSDGGRERIRVIDDGRGIHRDDLILAVTRHATSKLRTPEQLVEIHTLGFRGEALASIAAVARVEIRSRRAGEAVGHRLALVPGEAQHIEPIGMPFGTQVEVAHLFATVPARRKFLRADATEIGHCVDAVIRAALVHPEVSFRIRHDGRELLELRADSQTARVLAILDRRGGAGPYCHFTGERDGVHLTAWFAPPSSATRQRSGSFVVVRRRVVHERTLQAVLKQAYGDALPSGASPVACLFVEPPRGTVDVNVHPQKSEVRFATAQRVYAAVRELVEEGLATASWRVDQWPSPSEHPTDTRSALASWSRREGLSSGLIARDQAEDRGRAAYSLGTRAVGPASDRQGFRGDVERLRSSLAGPGERPRERAWAGPMLPHTESAFDEPGGPAREELPEPDASDELGPRLLTCLPGPVALFELDGELLVADLRRVRAHLVRRRLLRELAATEADGQAPAQALLQPIVVARAPELRDRLLAAQHSLRRLGLELEGFGDASVLVRAVPAVLPKLLDARGVGALLDRLIPWLEIGDQTVDANNFADAIAQLSAATVDTSPRLARRWIAELLREHDGRPDHVPGIRRWSPTALLGEDKK
jgi:DNA mismatch repair protein MutL